MEYPGLPAEGIVLMKVARNKRTEIYCNETQEHPHCLGVDAHLYKHGTETVNQVLLTSTFIVPFFVCVCVSLLTEHHSLDRQSLGKWTKSSSVVDMTMSQCLWT